MKTIWLLIITMVLASMGVSAIANYGIYNYGSGEYGENTPPLVTAFQPSDTTPTFNQSANVTFNITYVDYDGDTVTLSWYANTTFNASDKNLSYQFNNLGTFNITARLNDTWELTQQEWEVSIQIIVTSANLSDIIIIPKITTNGNVIIVTVNVTASTANAENVYAFLNVPYGATILSTITAQNQSLGTVYTNNITQVQWILSTPYEFGSSNLNVSYSHNQGAVQGENEKLYVTEQEDFMSVAIIIAVMAIIGVYLYLAKNLTFDVFDGLISNHGFIKSLIYILTFWILLFPMGLAIRYNLEINGAGFIDNTLQLMYVVMLYINWIFSAYLPIWLFYMVYKSAKKTVGKQKGEDGAWEKTRM